MLNPHHASLELVARILKPPTQTAYLQFLYETVSKLSKRKGPLLTLAGPQRFGT